MRGALTQWRPRFVVDPTGHLQRILFSGDQRLAAPRFFFTTSRMLAFASGERRAFSTLSTEPPIKGSRPEDEARELVKDATSLVVRKN